MHPQARRQYLSPATLAIAASAAARDDEADGTRVRTEESWEGELPGPIEAVQAALDTSLMRRLAALKIRAESVAR